MADRSSSDRTASWALGLAITAGLVGLGLPVALGAPAAWIGACGAALLWGALTVHMPRPWIVWVGRAGLFALIFLAVSIGTPWWWLTALASYASGLIVLPAVRALRTPPAPAPQRWLCWDEGSGCAHLLDPSADRVREHVASLDGDRHTIVSVVTGGTRLDVCCPSSNVYWVFHTGWDGRRSVVHQAVPATMGAGGEMAARLGGMDFHYPADLGLDQGVVREVVDWFLVHGGQRNPSARWQVSDRDHEVLVPPPVSALSPDRCPGADTAR